MKRKILIIMLCVGLLHSPLTLSEKADIHIGVMVYNTADTFMMTIVNEIERLSDNNTSLTVLNSANDQNLQAKQMKTLIEKGVDALIINAVDRTSCIYLLKIAKKSDVPVVFINREPLREDMESYNRAYYVGTQPQQQGMLCGEIIADYFLTTPSADKNGDGIIQYVLLKGEEGHQDTYLRSLYCIETLQNKGIKTEQLGSESGDWKKTRGQQIMASFLAEYENNIECVISNNDDMALGAIDALKAAGYFTNGRYMPVVGVDATPPALEAMEDGVLLGTVLNDARLQGAAAIEIATLLARKETIDKEKLIFPMQEDRFIWVPAKKYVKLFNKD
ncbi:MAG: galactose ABC transporter substrate-binding protein [Eubacteriales bacterium]|nr:galactose ABC transporter substrate-binding protein [Eubacteriales bacterium]